MNRFGPGIPAVFFLALMFALVWEQWGTHAPDLVSSTGADQILVTFPGDPASTLAVSWRAPRSATAGTLRIRKDGGAWQNVRAFREASASLAGNRLVAIATDLYPDTLYEYQVMTDGWWGGTPTRVVRTAPRDADEAIRFVYLGDVQTGVPEWGRQFSALVSSRPDLRFALLTGDLVNFGAMSTLWDEALAAAGDAFASIPVVPAIGNHETFAGGGALFDAFFVLPSDGPVAPERAYVIRYGPLLLAVLDTTDRDRIEVQAQWLDQVLTDSHAIWKIVAFHHPIWTSVPRRDSAWLRDVLVPVFDRHAVDLVLTGHDHVYSRTWPLRAGSQTPDGTVYCVANAGSKHYRTEPSPLFAKILGDVSTWQVITLSSERLIFESYRWDGTAIDRYERVRSTRP